MAESMNVRLEIFPDLQSASEALAADIVNLVASALQEREHFTLALSGGSTPKTLYQILAEDYGQELPWEQIHVFWSDERYVPPDSEESNQRMVREALLNRTPVPPENVHPIQTETMDPMSSSRAYEDELVDFFDDPTPRFDLILLGIGTDGHTASLFPHSAVLEEKQRLVMPVSADAEPQRRLTFTYPLINNARHVSFLAAGVEKAEAVRDVVS